MSVTVITAVTVSAHYIWSRLSLYTQAENVSDQAENEVCAVIRECAGAYSFAVKDLDNPFLKISGQEQRRFVAASLIKLPILAGAFFAVEGGKISLEDECVLKKKDIARGSGILKHGRLPRRITFKRLLECMITRSDNTAANKIIDILGFDYINSICEKLGLKETALNRKIMDLDARRKGVENYISCRDAVYLLEKIYRKELVGASYSEMMLSFLAGQKINDRIPKYLPKEATVAHKTGLEKNVVADAGIVFTTSGDYIICVISSDFPDYKTAKDCIAKISLAVYNTFKEAK